ncbi:MAG: hypothetical protein VW268_09290 [Rhodospirillaceae bacterium]
MNMSCEQPEQNTVYRPTTQKIITFIILCLGVLITFSMSFGATAYAQSQAASAKANQDLTFKRAHNSLSAYVDHDVTVTARMTYVPDDFNSAILRDRNASLCQSLFAMNLHQFGDSRATAPGDKSLFVRVTRVPGQSRRWMVKECADGCRVQVAGQVVRSAEGKILLDVHKVMPAGK